MTEHSQETKVAILEAKVEHMVGHVTELTKRVRAVEKVCAIVSAVGIGAGGIVGTTVFNTPPAEAEERLYTGNMFNPNEWIQRMKNWEAEQNYTDPDDAINNALASLEMDYGSDDPPKPKILLQFPSDGDYESLGWGYD